MRYFDIHGTKSELGTSKGFRIFTTDPFTKSYETKDGNIAILEMLFSTSLVALILSPRRLQITNTKVCVCKVPCQPENMPILTL